jgi:cytoskeletal protein CcmA (bactofilin family)
MAMFGGEDEKNMEPQAETIVGVDVTIKGNFKSPSNITVNGTVKGQVDTKTDVNVGEKATIEGSIHAKKVTVSGTVQGNVEARESLEITPTGKIFGDITTSNLMIQSGAIFVGKSVMVEKGELQETEEELESIEEAPEEAEIEAEAEPVEEEVIQ